MGGRAAVLLACCVLPVQAADTPDWSTGVMPETPDCSEAALRRDKLQWMGMPVMPGFVEAKKGGVVCNYNVKVRVAEAEAWYGQQMTKAGWQSSVLGRRDSNPITHGPMVRVEYRRGSEVVNVILLDAPKDGETVVMLRRVRYPGEK